jgi:hypothetical protein
MLKERRLPSRRVPCFCKHEWTRKDTNFFAVSAMSLLTVPAAVPAPKVIHAGDTPASTFSNYGRGRGLGCALGVGVILGTGVEVAVGVAVEVGVGFGVAVDVAVGVGLGVEVAVGVAVGLAVGVGLGAAGTIAYA